MGVHKGRRVSLTLRTDTYDSLRAIQVAAGFRCFSALIGAVLTLLMKAPELARLAAAKPSHGSVEAEIAEMFADLADYESPEYGERCRSLQRTAL